MIEKWLKAGYVANIGEYHKAGTFEATNRGTPQGGNISPLLCNIALHGMQETLGIRTRWNKKRNIYERDLRYSHYGYAKYCDDFVVFARTKEDAIKG